jgi:hypothetical protein
MPPISTKVHGVLDYVGGFGSLAAPKLLRDRRAAAMLSVSGAGTLATSAITDYELGLRRILPMPMHLFADAATGALLLTGALALRRGRAKLLDWVPVAMAGIAELAAAALTEQQPSDRLQAAPEEPLPAAPAGVSGEGLAATTVATAGPPLASGPIETPGPSVTPPATPESDVERTERADALAPDPRAAASDDALVAQEESAAAAEAARIGGRAPADADDPAMDPVYQAGGGEQEGWEQAEEELIENASHGDGGGQPERDAFAPELESDRSGAVYGEADRLSSTEVVEDPGAGADDPGDGPGLSADRGEEAPPHEEPPAREE